MPLSDSKDRPSFVVEIVESIDEVDAQAWDHLVPADDPFCTHAFLAALERSGSASADTGWMPAHVLVRASAESSALLAAVPAYVKDHSYGEYIFDWGWAQASQRAGIPYYPKVVAAVPFTPATGRRLLVAPGGDVAVLEDVLLRGLRHLAQAAKALSVHVLFCSQGEWSHGQTTADGMIGRITTQFHWDDQGYGNFDGWLASFR